MDAETNCLLCSHGWHGDWCSVSYGGGLSCACRKSPAPQQPPAQGIDCPRCEATGTEPDPDTHDERSYPCALCSGSGEITRAVRDAIRDAVPPSAADSAGEAQRTAEERLAAAWDEGYRAAQRDALEQPYSDLPEAKTWRPRQNPHAAGAS